MKLQPNDKHHLVFACHPTYANAHTHVFGNNQGQPDFRGHIDFQVVLPLPPKHLNSVLNALMDWALAREEPIEENVLYDQIFQMPVKFVKRTENGRPVMRCIFTDEDGLFEDSPNPIYAGQADVGDLGDCGIVD